MTSAQISMGLGMNKKDTETVPSSTIPTLDMHRPCITHAYFQRPRKREKMGPEQLCLSGLTRSLAGSKKSSWYILLLRVWLVAAFVDLKQSNAEFIQ